MRFVVGALFSSVSAAICQSLRLVRSYAVAVAIGDRFSRHERDGVDASSPIERRRNSAQPHTTIARLHELEALRAERFIDDEEYFHRRDVLIVHRNRSFDVARPDSSVRVERFLATSCRSPNRHPIHLELMDRFAEALDSLPEPEKQALILHKLQGKPLIEIAERLERSPAQVVTLLRRGIQKLRAALAEGDA